MRKLQDIPILGKIVRILSSFVKAPKLFDALFDAARQSDLRLKDMQQALNAQTVRIAAIEKRLYPIENADSTFVDQFISGLQRNQDGMVMLNRSLSSCPTVWGPPDRLHISPDASVHSCFFNTNSGHITVGPFTFSGSHVSLLAGSHDPVLTGAVRRDADYQEGFDITIGSGVWLASGCTVLGPCTVGDNAVIAAGAVVVPGTNVPPGTVYGGVPARLIRKLNLSDQAERKAIAEGLERNNGFLFVSGWSQRLSGYLPSLVYKLLAPEAVVCTNRTRAKLSYCLVGNSPVVLTFVSPAAEENLLLDGEKGEIELAWSGEQGQLITLSFRRQSGEGDVFLILQ